MPIDFWAKKNTDEKMLIAPNVKENILSTTTDSFFLQE
jgi:hypothetical protein